MWSHRRDEDRDVAVQERNVAFKNATSQFKSGMSQFKSATLQFSSQKGQSGLQTTGACSACSIKSQLSLCKPVHVDRVVNSSSSARQSSVLGTGLPPLVYVFASSSGSTWQCSASQMKQIERRAHEAEEHREACRAAHARRDRVPSLC